MAKTEKPAATGNGAPRTFTVREMAYSIEWPITLKAALSPGRGGVAPFADETSVLTAANLYRNAKAQAQQAIRGRPATKKSPEIAPTANTPEAVQKLIDGFTFDASQFRARGTGKGKLPKIDPKTLVGKSEKEIATMLASLGYEV